MDAPARPAHEALASLLVGAEQTVVLTGLRLGEREPPDLADARGEWARRASLEAFLTRPADFWAYYHPHALEVAAREPTPAHHALARLQREGVVDALITQAVDRLHLRAGSPEAVEVYGHVLAVRCERCGERYALAEVGPLMARGPDGVPRCTTPGCAYPVRPEVTLWGEPLPAAAVSRAWELAAGADCLVVLDCDLRTAPISLLPSVPLTRQVPLVVVGEAPTQYDRYAALRVREASPPLLAAVADLLAPARGAADPAGP